MCRGIKPKRRPIEDEAIKHIHANRTAKCVISKIWMLNDKKLCKICAKKKENNPGNEVPWLRLHHNLWGTTPAMYITRIEKAYTCDDCNHVGVWVHDVDDCVACRSTVSLFLVHLAMAEQVIYYNYRRTMIMMDVPMFYKRMMLPNFDPGLDHFGMFNAIKEGQENGVFIEYEMDDILSDL